MNLIIILNEYNFDLIIIKIKVVRFINRMTFKLNQLNEKENVFCIVAFLLSQTLYKIWSMFVIISNAILINLIYCLKFI